MGQEESSIIDDSVEPVTLRSRDIPSLASYILSSRCKTVAVLTGAGISTSAGIPDFRSPETGLYANLARLNLPYAEAVFSIDYFREKPEPFYMLARELYPGKYRPTITHSFIHLLEKKGLLLKHFTQNIDCLDREAGVSGENVIEAHGSFASQRCIECKTAYPDKEMREHVRTSSIPRCVNADCNGLVKPDIVFFGEALPSEFFNQRGLVGEADLVIVMGTSLTVQPFASLPGLAGEGVPRVLINLEQVGGLGGRADDVLILEDCDGGVKKLAEALGWLGELEALWAETGTKFGVEPHAPPKADMEEGNGPAKSNDEKLEDEVDKLTREVDAALTLNKAHSEKTSEEFADDVHRDAFTRSGDAEGGAKNKTSITPLLTDAAVTSAKGEQRDRDTGAADAGLSHVSPHVEKKKSAL